MRSHCRSGPASCVQTVTKTDDDDNDDEDDGDDGTEFKG